MSDPKVKDTEAGPLAVLRPFLHKLQCVRRRRPLLKGQRIPNSVTARLRRHLSGRAQWQPAGS
jgi:hypothetical protein